MVDSWRFIISNFADGSWNMAVDEAILSEVSSVNSPPTIRLYGWMPPCLSLGVAQPFSDIDLERLQQNGWSIVRRPTGGRAILHTDELTYSIIAPKDHPLVEGSILESYQRLSQGLLYTLSLFGIDAMAQKKYASSAPADNGAVCFEVPSNYELTISGKKLIGSAQARKYDGVLQHGSIPLFGDISRIVEVLKYSDEMRREEAKYRVLSRAATIESVSGNQFSFLEAALLFKQAFQTEFNLDFFDGFLSESEIVLATNLQQSKYANKAWTERL